MTAITSNTQPLASHKQSKVEFVAIDWGTSNFRLWSIGTNNKVLNRMSGPYGMSTLSSHQYEDVLEKSLSDLGIEADVPVVICGMAGAKQGWVEAPYRQTPTSLNQLGENAIKVPGVARDIRIASGVMQAEPANVMRGEETQLLGLLQEVPDFDGVVVLPGTHCKWVRIRSGRIEQFMTCMTGEMFTLLSEHSVLKHSTIGNGWDADAYLVAVERSLDNPESVAGTLFSLRSEMLLNHLEPDIARARLSGMLVGLELAATRKFSEAQTIALIGAEPLCGHYAEAMALNSVSPQIYNNEAMTVSGLVTVANQTWEPLS